MLCRNAFLLQSNVASYIPDSCHLEREPYCLTFFGILVDLESVLAKEIEYQHPVAFRREEHLYVRNFLVILQDSRAKSWDTI